MIGWLIFFAYVVMAFVSARISWVLVTESKCSCGAIRSGRTKHDYLCDINPDAALAAILFGSLWPLFLVFFFPVRWVVSPTPRQKNALKEKKAQEELAELKKKARELGLPL